MGRADAVSSYDTATPLHFRSEENEFVRVQEPGVLLAEFEERMYVVEK